MSELSNVMAKLAGVRHAIDDAIHENVSRNRSDGGMKTRANFKPAQVQHYFVQTYGLIERLKKLLPELYGDFHSIETEPDTPMADSTMNFSHSQGMGLVRAIDQIFEIRANSELTQPAQQATVVGRVFISHGRSPDWQKVQPFLEKDV